MTVILHLRAGHPRLAGLRLLYSRQILHRAGKDAALYLRERKEVVYENLRDLNFEYKAGKFPDSDYQAMKTSLEDEAAAILAEIARLEQCRRRRSASLRDRKGARV